ncbi:MAG: hypothetical protein ACYCT7_04305 [bacterium]
MKLDLVRKKFSLPTKSNYTFLSAWEQYIKSQTVSQKTIEVKITSSKHFLPIFKTQNYKYSFFN